MHRLLDWTIHAVQTQREPPSQDTEGQISRDELAGLRCRTDAAGTPHGMVVRPGKAGMFSRSQTCRGRSQSPVVRMAGFCQSSRQRRRAESPAITQPQSLILSSEHASKLQSSFRWAKPDRTREAGAPERSNDRSSWPERPSRRFPRSASHQRAAAAGAIDSSASEKRISSRVVQALPAPSARCAPLSGMTGRRHGGW